MMWFDFFVKPIMVLIIAEIYREIFLRINSPKSFFNSKTGLLSQFKMDLVNLKLKSTINMSYNSFLYKYTPIVLFCLNFMLIILFPFDNTAYFFTYDYSLLLIFIIILLNKLIALFLCITSQNPNRFQATKEIITGIINYDFPIMLSLIAIFIQVTFTQTERNFINLGDIIAYQQDFSDPIFGISFPALILILNPFSFLAYISALIGAYREKNLGVIDKTDLLDKWKIDDEFNGHKKALLSLSKTIQMIILISLIFPLFIGYYWSPDNLLINDGWILMVALIIVVIIALIGGSRPRTKIDRTILNWIRTPHIFAFLSIIYAILFGFIG